MPKRYLFIIAFLLIFKLNVMPDTEIPLPLIEPERAVADNAPQSIKNAVKNAPKDVLIGIGSAKMAMMSMSRSAANARARAEIARQVNEVTTVLIRYHSVINEADLSDEVVFKETIIVSLSKAALSGVSIIEEDRDAEGSYWVAAMMSKPDLIEQIKEVQEEANDAAPAMASFDAETLINASIR